MPRKSQATGTSLADMRDAAIARYQPDAFYAAERKRVYDRALIEYQQAATRYVPAADLPQFADAGGDSLLAAAAFETSPADADTDAPTSDPIPAKGRPVREFGIVYKKEGANLREGRGGRVTGALPFNERVFVDTEFADSYGVTTADGRKGHVAKTHLKRGLPDPESKIHWVAPGETGLEISRQYYGGEASFGEDHRDFINVLALVNEGEGRRGIFLPQGSDDWADAQAVAGVMIWIPSTSFMKSLLSEVGSASITHGAIEKASAAAKLVGDVTLGSAAMVAGLLHGALESVWDILAGLVDLAGMAWGVIESAFTGSLLGDAVGLWESLSGLDWGGLLQGLVSDFDAKWNSEDLLTRWHFRGWVLGYAIAEILMLVFSAGLLQGLKWAGKSAKLTKALKAVPQITKAAEVAKETKAGKALMGALKKADEGKVADDLADAGKGPDWADEVAEAGDKIEDVGDAGKVPGAKRWPDKPGDPAYARNGPARVSHAKEYEEIMATLRRNKVKVTDRPGALGYQPSSKPGKPGELFLDPDASYSAVRHEYQHYLDDLAQGFPGQEVLYQPNARWAMEKSAYAKEIALARRAGDKALIAELEALRLTEWQRIFKPGLFE